MSVTLKVKNIDRFVDQFKLGGGRPTVKMGLKITGPAAAYALVWEFGRADIKPGPKTLWGTNPDGERRVLTRTAPSGYIRVNKNKFRLIIRDEMKKIVWRKIKPREIPNAVQWALEKAAPRIADLIAETAPFDTGALRAAIRAVSIIGPAGMKSVVNTVPVRARLRRAS